MVQAPPPINPVELVHVIWTNRWKCILPALGLGLMATGYSLLLKKYWAATLPIVVRDEANMTSDRPGRFSDADAMKSAQETILERARSQAVLAAALTKVGPPPGYARPSQWPTLEDIEKVTKRISISAPNGAEFGRTEVIHLTVQQTRQNRAVELATAVCDALETHVRDLRERKAESLISELTQSVELWRSELRDTTRRISTFEQQVGSDLGELRLLGEGSSGESNLRSRLVRIQDELRNARLDGQSAQQQLDWLRLAGDDPQYLLEAPRRLLESQPALRLLKEGLIASKLEAAQLRGTMQANHPQVKAAALALAAIKEQIAGELQSAIRGTEVELTMYDDRIDLLDRQRAAVDDRLKRLANLRAPYANLVAEARTRSASLAKAEQELTAARANQAAAQSSSLIMRVDTPRTGNDPEGPRRAYLVLGGMVAGGLLGLGLVFLTSPVGTDDAIVSGVANAESLNPVNLATGERLFSEHESQRDQEPEYCGTE